MRPAVVQAAVQGERHARLSPSRSMLMLTLVRIGLVWTGRLGVPGLHAADVAVRETAAALAYNLALILPNDDSDPVVEDTSAVLHQLEGEPAAEAGTCMSR